MSDNAIILPAIGDEDDYFYDPAPINISMPSFPTAKGKTERNARNTCVRSVRSSIAGKACLKIIKNFDIQLYIDQCVTDVRVSIITENENMLKIIKFEFSYVQRG